MTREEAVKEGIRALGYGSEPNSEEHVSVGIFAGHEGVGWYAWNTHYPEEGSMLVGAALTDDIVHAYLSAPEGSPTEDRLHHALVAVCGTDEAAAAACNAYIDAHGPVAPSSDGAAANARTPERGDHVEVRYWDTGSGDGWVPAIVTHVQPVGDSIIVAASGRRPDGSVCGPHVTGFWGDRVRPVASEP